MTDRSDSELPEEAPWESKPREPQGRPAERISQDADSLDQRISSGADAQTDDSRSGADVREAVDVAESGTEAEGDHSHPERAKTGEAPVEQVYSDPAMTEGQHTATGAATTGGLAPGPSPAEAGSGGAQSVVGARESDRRAAGEPPASGAPFETVGHDQPTGKATDDDGSRSEGRVEHVKADLKHAVEHAAEKVKDVFKKH